MVSKILYHPDNLFALFNNEAGTEIASRQRPPLDELPRPEYSSDSGDDSEDAEDDSEDGSPPTELGLHMTSIMEILGDLYKLSFRIRNTATRPKSLKPTLYKEVDEETGVDKFSVYADLDLRHVEESISQLRRDVALEKFKDESNKEKSEAILSASKIRDDHGYILEGDEFLIKRLATTLTKRRKILRYWQRHSKKLAEIPREVRGHERSMPELVATPMEIVPELALDSPKAKAVAPTEKTYLSKTEATSYDRKLDDILETQSAISYASTTFDIHGNTVNLPPPPAAASKGIEFLCPYCSIVCPSRHGTPRVWKGHILQDIQPYVCTYPDCLDGLQVYGSRTAWLEHERLVHRRVWQCFEHRNAVFSSQSDLQNHLESKHSDITETHVQNLLETSESSIGDSRSRCPICLLEGPFAHGLDKHLAYHLESFAVFSVFSGLSNAGKGEDDESSAEGQSGQAQGLGSVDSLRSLSLHFESNPSLASTSVLEDPDTEGAIHPESASTVAAPSPKMKKLSLADYKREEALAHKAQQQALTSGGIRPSSNAVDPVFSSPLNRPVFGMPLGEAVEVSQPIGVDLPLPAIVYRCLEYLQVRGAVQEEGIFRFSGSNTVIKALRERFDTEGDVKLLDGDYYDIHAIASLLKLYLRELPSPILTREHQLDFLKVLDVDSISQKLAALNSLVDQLPPANRSLLQALFSFLISIVGNANRNKMTIRNIGIVFASILNIPAPLISTFLTDYATIFGKPHWTNEILLKNTEADGEETDVRTAYVHGSDNAIHDSSGDELSPKVQIERERKPYVAKKGTGKIYDEDESYEIVEIEENDRI